MPSLISLRSSDVPSPHVFRDSTPEDQNLNVCGCSEESDWVSFGLILFELNLVVLADYFGEQSSGNAISELKKLASPTCRVKRGEVWKSIPKTDLVPGDIVALVIGSVVPADGVLRAEGPKENYAPLVIDAAAVTGEPLPERKYVGDEVLASTSVLSGELEMQVTKTGERSSMGEALKLIGNVKEKGGNLKRMLSLIAKSIVIISSFFCFAIALVLLIRDGKSVAEAMKQAMVILLATLPVAMPLVITTGLAIGALELSREKAIVQRLSCIEEMAGMDILCSDKTGTLTLGRMAIIKSECVAFDGHSRDDLLLMALLASRRVNTDPIDTAVINAFSDPNIPGSTVACDRIIHERLKDYREDFFVPFSPLNKKVTATIYDRRYGNTFLVAKGAPEVMNALPGISAKTERKANEVVESASLKAYKSLGVCVSYDNGTSWQMIGYLAIFDPPRYDSKETIEHALGRGVSVKMITGDQKKIAVEISKQLGLGGAIFGPEIWSSNSEIVDQAGGVSNLAELADGFASVKPTHKYRVVTSLQDKNHIVGMTGDGVNDAPALKISNVGIAVAGATDAARGAADIILTQEGLSTIITAINRSRMIFRRLQAYIIYRLASSTFFVLFFTLSICALDFEFPTWVLIMVSLVNDFTAMSTSMDSVRTSSYPLYWDFAKIGILSITIGLMSVIQCFLLLYFARAGEIKYVGMKYIGMGDLLDCEVVALVFLNMVCTIQLNIFSARNKKFFWQTSEADDASPAPSRELGGTVFLVIFICTFIAVYWDPEMKLGGGNPMKGCGWVPAIGCLFWCFFWFFATECVKQVAYHTYENKDDVEDLLFRPFYKLMDLKQPAPNVLTDPDNNLAALNKSVVMAANETADVKELPPMIALSNWAGHDDLVSQINAMRAHIEYLEQRLHEVDGKDVARQGSLTTSND